MTDRTTLALAACAGLSDAELAERGNQGYAKMIQRKRKYAQAARMMAVANAHLAKELADLMRHLGQTPSADLMSVINRTGA